MIFTVFSSKNTVNRENDIKICVINFTVSRQKKKNGNFLQFYFFFYKFIDE